MEALTALSLKRGLNFVGDGQAGRPWPWPWGGARRTAVQEAAGAGLGVAPAAAVTQASARGDRGACPWGTYVRPGDGHSGLFDPWLFLGPSADWGGASGKNTSSRIWIWMGFGPSGPHRPGAPPRRPGGQDGSSRCPSP